MAQEIKVAKILTRTGLKSSLPQPLSPGEFGTALDTGEVFIGLNPTNTAANNALPIINCYASVVDSQTYANQLISTYLFQVDLTNPGITNTEIDLANDDNVIAGFTRRYIKVSSRLYISYEYKYTGSVLDIPVTPNTGLGTELLLSAATGTSFVNNTLDLSLLGTYTWQDTSAIASLMNFAFTPSSGLKSGLVNVEQNLRLLTEVDLVTFQTENVPVISVNGIKNLQTITSVQYTTGFYSNTTIGNGHFLWSPSTDKTLHNGGTIIAPEAIEAWDGSQADIGTLLNWSGIGTGCFIRRRNKEHNCQASWFGVTSDTSTIALRKAIASSDNRTLIIDTSTQIDGVVDVTCGLSFSPGCFITQLNGGYNMLNVIADNIEIRNPQLINAGVKTTIFSDVSLYLNGRSNVKVSGGTFIGHRSAGIGGVDNKKCTIKGNTFLSSPVNPTTDNHTQSGGDIYLLNSTFDCLITRNYCLSGAGIGIGLQSVNSAKHVKNNKIYKNVVIGQHVYGIMLYRGPTDSFFDDNLIDGNTVEDITGNVADAVYGKTYGAGIYVQAADNTTVCNNNIKNTNQNTLIELLAPAAIGVNLIKSVTVINNKISNPNWYGIIILDPFSLSDGKGIINVSGNHIRNSGKTAIFAKDVTHGVIDKNTINNVIAGHGIRIANTTTNNTDEWIITKNNIDGCSSNGITMDAGNYVEIGSNRIRNCLTHGISSAALYSDITKNNVKSCTSRGFEIKGAVQDGEISKNIAISCGTNYYIAGIIYGAENNKSVSPVSAGFDGSYYPSARLPDGATMLTVGGNKHWITNNSAPTNVVGIVSSKDFQICQIRMGDPNTTFVHSSSFRLINSVNFTAPGGSILIMQRDSATTNSWYEIGRYRG